MNKLVLVLFLTVLLYCPLTISAQKADSCMVKELNYGLGNSKKAKKEMSGSPSGHHNIIQKFKITNRTDTISALLGTQFGVEYELLCKEKKSPIQITWLFPESMTDQNGKPMLEFTYSITSAANKKTFSNYTFESPNELVKGSWTFIISKDGVELYRKVFYII